MRVWMDQLLTKATLLCTRQIRKRFMVPMEYLSRNLLIELLRKSEEEYGLPSDGAISLPCDSTMLEYVVSLVGRRMSEELEKALFTSTATYHQLASSSSLAQGQSHHQQLISGY
ncbi:hypothetical protein Dsin_027202 [Dipteronia sinensis]|uniref:Small auxin up regulated protein n=1 Tax=Dipteronia sinensis TaxID=43782 RepID=A0AAD9ZZ67_9ROSI|nr:hypothetical protein Dsin_027202 [Dipteronia sinensis]